MWSIHSYGDQYDTWFDGLAPAQQDAVLARLDLLRHAGPSLGRPVVDSIEASRHHNMKELRCAKGGALRVLFIFDPLRQAILLIGGDKTGRWNERYREAIPMADDLYDRYQAELRDEGLI